MRNLIPRGVLCENFCNFIEIFFFTGRLESERSNSEKAFEEFQC